MRSSEYPISGIFHDIGREPRQIVRALPTSIVPPHFLFKGRICRPDRQHLQGLISWQGVFRSQPSPDHPLISLRATAARTYHRFARCAWSTDPPGTITPDLTKRPVITRLPTIMFPTLRARNARAPIACDACTKNDPQLFDRGMSSGFTIFEMLDSPARSPRPCADLPGHFHRFSYSSRIKRFALVADCCVSH